MYTQNIGNHKQTEFLSKQINPPLGQKFSQLPQLPVQTKQLIYFLDIAQWLERPTGILEGHGFDSRKLKNSEN